MKKILLLLLTFFTLQVSYAADIDKDGVIDGIDNEETFYSIIESNFGSIKNNFLIDQKDIYITSSESKINIETIDASNSIIFLSGGIRTTLDTALIGSSKIIANHYNKEYYYTSNYSKIYDESKIISYICNSNDVENENDTYPNGELKLDTIGYGCSNSTLGVFSITKFNIVNSIKSDTDDDGIYDNDYQVSINGTQTTIKDNEVNTTSDNKQYICTVNNVENRDYDCNVNSKIGKFSQIKKDTLVYGGDRDGDGVPDEDDKETTEFKDEYTNIPELMSSIKPIFLDLIPVNISKITKHGEYVTTINGTKIDSKIIVDSYEQANGGYYRNFDLEDIQVFDESKLVNFVCTTSDTSTWTSDDCISDEDNYPVSSDSACCNNTSNLGKFSWSKFYKTFGYNYKDSDGDGVFDSNDSCENTTEGATDVDENGCSASKKDTDGDGIIDSEDKCPNTKYIHKRSISPSGSEMAGCYRKCKKRDTEEQKGSTLDKVRGKGEVNENLGECKEWAECKESEDGRCTITCTNDNWNGEKCEDGDWYNNMAQTTDQGDNLKLDISKGESGGRNKPLKDLIEDDTDFFKTRIGGTQGTYNMTVKIAYSLKNLFLIIATIYLLILVFKVFFTSGSDEEIGKFKKGIVWTTVGMMVMQTSYAFSKALYDKNITEGLAADFGIKIIQPFIDLTLLFVSFAFLGVAIYSFYKIVTAGGDEEGIKKGKQTIIQAIIGFIVIKFTSFIVESTYGKIECTGGSDNDSFVQVEGRNCIHEAELEGNMEIIVQIINWANSLLAIIITILIIYAGVTIMLSGGDEEKMKKAKQSIIYIAIGLVILSSSYLILSFFIIPEVTI